MKIVKPETEILSNPTDCASLLAHIERCGRVCYKSEDRIGDGSAEKFISGVISRKHFAVVEHGNLIYRLSRSAYDWLVGFIAIEEDKGFQSYIRHTAFSDSYIVSGNVRAFRDLIDCLLADNEYAGSAFLEFLYKVLNLKDLGILFEDYSEQRSAIRCTLSKEDIAPITEKCIWSKQIWDENELTDKEKFVHVTRTVRFVCDRGVSHEIVRHRPASYCQESTRYCNYSKGQFNGEVSFIQPVFFTPGSVVFSEWASACALAEKAYFGLLDIGCTPQEARSVLPNSLKTEVMMTATLSEWQHFFDLRMTPAAHPQMREVAIPLSIEMAKLYVGLILPTAN